MILVRGPHWSSLCSLCADRFKEFVKRDEGQRQELRERVANGEELQFTVDLGDKTGSIRFVEKHLLDVRGLLTGEEERVNSENAYS